MKGNLNLVILWFCPIKPQRQNEAVDKETGTEEELEHGDDDDDDDEELEFSVLAAVRKKPVKRQGKKSVSHQIIKSQ